MYLYSKDRRYDLTSTLNNTTKTPDTGYKSCHDHHERWDKSENIAQYRQRTCNNPEGRGIRLRIQARSGVVSG